MTIATFPARRRLAEFAGVEVAFFASGFAALTYQICWQRILFSSFGVDIESITIIVSTFMLGLGCGALLGGWLSDRHPSRLLLVFAACETGIGLFGIVSADLIRAVADATVRTSLSTVALVNFILLLAPTMLMGATLPILVAHVIRRTGSVGISVGGLYFINTLGAATACLVVGFVWFDHYGLRAAIHAAAIVNFLVAAVAAGFTVRRP